MSEMGKYIYGIIPRLGLGQVNFNGVHTISYQDISAVVGDSEIVEYTIMLKDALARQLVRHQKVIEEIMPEYTVIPMRLGTFAEDEAEVKDILIRGYEVIKDIFEKITDKIEIDVAAIWSDFDTALKEIGERKEIKEFKQKLRAAPKSITMDDQMKVGCMVKTALDEKRNNYASQIQNALQPISQDFRIHELMDDKMVVNIAFLIDRARRKDFDISIEELNTQFAEELNFRSVGPLPAYSFYTLEIAKMQFEDLDWARNKLGVLNAFTTKDEIKKAYHHQAFCLHPDKNPNRPGIAHEFDEIKRAYKILVDYCLACEQVCQQESFSFNEEVFKKNKILVRVKG